MSDTKRLNWLEENRCETVPFKERNGDGWLLWWVITKQGRSITHPYGNIRDAIDAAARERAEGG